MAAISGLTRAHFSFLLCFLGVFAILFTGPSVFAAPVTSHPRLWVTSEDLPRLRSWAAASNPLWEQGLAVLAEDAKADMDAGIVPNDDEGGEAAEGEVRTEKYAELFAFLSLVDPNETARSDYAQRARTLLMHVINEAAKGAADDQPFRDPVFSSSDRSRWFGEAFPLTVDWIYPVLSAQDKAAIRTVFLRWSDELVHAETTTNNHPEPIGVVNDPVLTSDPILVRWAGNNYYTAHMRNLGLMSMCLDSADDPGDTLQNYLLNATGAWLYVVDHLLRNDGAGGLSVEGIEYGPQAVGYIAQFLLALHTAGQDDPAVWGPQVVFQNNPYWNDIVPGYLHSMSPAPANSATLAMPVYRPAWYGDGADYWGPDYYELFGPLGLLDASTGNAARLQHLRWIQENMAPGLADRLLSRVRNTNAFASGILYFMLFDPAVTSYTDPRPSQALNFYAPGLNRILARTDWTENAAWFSYKLSWNSIDHQSGDGNQFEFYRRGEWLTKERTGYDLEWGSSRNHNTLCLENDPPAYNDPCSDLTHITWLMGSQWKIEPSGDPVLVAYSFGPTYVYALGDATNLYNSDLQVSIDITHASRSILWLKPDLIVVYDRASSQTAGRFKRFWLNFPAQATVTGSLVSMTTATGQRLFVTSLLPAGAELLAEPSDIILDCEGNPRGTPAHDEPMSFRLKIEAQGGPADARFLTVLQGADPGGSATPASLFQSGAGTSYEGALVGTTAFLFPVNISTPFASLTYTVPSATALHLITGLAPAGMYNAQLVQAGGNVQVTVTPGGSLQADSGGVLQIGSASTCTLACMASASPTSGQAPLTVNFTGSATATNCAGQPAYSWAFGDSVTSAQQNPSHTYTTAGIFNWTLTVTVDGETCTQSGSVTVNAVSCSLACTASASPTSGQAPLTVNFTGSATATNCAGQPVYSWAFGDGGTSTQQSPSHTYATEGTFAWTLTVMVDGQTCAKSGFVTATSTSGALWESRGIGGGGALFSPSISPYDPNIVYMATDMSAVFRSENFGTTWKTLPFTEIQGGVYSDVRFTLDPMVLYSLFLDDNDQRTPVKSTDGGETWTALANIPWDLEYTILHADPHSASRLLVSDWDALFFSNDGGATFSEVYRTGNPGRGMCFAGTFWDGNNIFAGTGDGLVVSTNGGTTFSLASADGIPSSEAMSSFAGAKEGNTIRFFAVTTDDFWHLASPTGYGGYRGVYRLNWGEPGWTQIAGIDPDALPFFAAMAEEDVDTCYVGGGRVSGQGPSIYKTANGGNTWTTVLQTEGNANVATGWMGQDGDLNWGWAESILGLAVSPSDPNRVIAPDWGFVHVTDDGGASWRQAYVDPSTQNPAGSPTPKNGVYRGVGLEDTSAWSLHWASPSILFASFTDIAGIRSTDGGLTWASALSSGLSYNSTYQVVQHPSNGTLYAATSSVHDLYQSLYLRDGSIDDGQGATSSLPTRGRAGRCFTTSAIRSSGWRSIRTTLKGCTPASSTAPWEGSSSRTTFLRARRPRGRGWPFPRAPTATPSTSGFLKTARSLQPTQAGGMKRGTSRRPRASS